MQNYVKPRKTTRNHAKLRETTRNYAKLCETPETTRNHAKLCEIRIVLPLALSEPEPTLPFGLSLSEPTYQHLPTFLCLLNINFTEKLPISYFLMFNTVHSQI